MELCLDLGTMRSYFTKMETVPKSLKSQPNIYDTRCVRNLLSHSLFLISSHLIPFYYSHLILVFSSHSSSYQPHPHQLIPGFQKIIIRIYQPMIPIPLMRILIIIRCSMHQYPVKVLPILSILDHRILLLSPI